MDKTKFGLFIKNSRLKKNYTQKKLADLLFIDVTAVSKWERGISYPDITLVPEICKILEISEHELIQSSSNEKYSNIIKDGDGLKTINTTINLARFCYIIALFICFMVNLTVNHTVSWFCIILTMCFIGLTFYLNNNKFYSKYNFLIFITSTFISLLLLFVICSLYTIFELSMDKHWFLIASSLTLFGSFSLFYKRIISKIKIYINDEKYIENKGYFIRFYSINLLLLNILLLFIINMYSEIDFLYGAVLIVITYYVLVFSCSIIEFLNINRLIKLGVEGFITFLELIKIGYIIMKVIGEDKLSITLTSLLLLVIGLIKEKKEQ